jgi:methionine salvage enolase-phosphatase E1
MADLAEGFGVVVFDIEGTVCPISFVKDVLVST